MGGAMIVADTAKVGMKRATFIENAADKAGGALALLGSSILTVSTAFFQANRADLGGAMYSTALARPTAVATVFLANIATNGGAIMAADGSAPLLEQCELTMNRASRGGAMYADDTARPKLVGCQIKQNFAAMDGGAVFAAFDSSPDFEECHFVDNNSNLGDVFYISAGAQQTIKFTQCSVYPHPKTFNEPLMAEAGFPEQVHVW